jgi:hypothetical protein
VFYVFFKKFHCFYVFFESQVFRGFYYFLSNQMVGKCLLVLDVHVGEV